VLRPGESMPIRRFLGHDTYFEPDDLTVMGEAFSAALTKLDLHDRNDALVEQVARRIIRAALNGERDPVRLTEIGAGGRDPC
jgi:hypothetical protein